MALWFQGCNIGCKGCCNPELRPFVKKHMLSMSQILEIVDDSRSRYGIEGVTFIGGEPTLQGGLIDLIIGLKGKGLGTILFTGNVYEELDLELRENVDLIIDGKFEIERRDLSRNLIGSTNQRIIDVSGRYSNEIGWFTERRPDYIEIDLDGEYYITNGSVF